MNFTDIFIKRPVLAIVISLFILLVGLRSLQLLTVAQYPKSESAIIRISTTYTGADADLVKGFITTPLEREIASADGINYLTSSSLQGVSTITAHLELNYPPYDALTQITSKVNRVRADLPEESEDPVLELAIGEAASAMYLSFNSDSRCAAETRVGSGRAAGRYSRRTKFRDARLARSTTHACSRRHARRCLPRLAGQQLPGSRRQDERRCRIDQSECCDRPTHG
jgi:hypothetical protein